MNGADLGIVAGFTQRPDGSLAMNPADLAAVGLAGNAAAVAPDGLVDLRRMPGLRYKYDEVTQSIALTMHIDPILPHHIDAAGPSRPLAPVVSGRGAVVNYTLYGAADTAWQSTAAATFEARLYEESGLFTQSGLVKTSTGFTRLDTTFARSDRDRMITWEGGDFISGGLAWTRPLRMAGFRIARNFALRPDLVTMPLPGFNGSAAVPSTVDIYTDGAKVFSGMVAAGPFSIANLPVVTGGGNAHVVITDALGRQTTADLPFFADANLLKQGLADFSVEAGFPRRSYGVESYDYAGPALSGSVRYGLTDRLTGEAHAEIGGGIWNGGAGFVAPAGRLGMMSAAVAASIGDHTGVAVNGGVDLVFGKVGVRARVTRTFGDYADVASATAAGPGENPATAIDQVSLAAPLFGGSAALSFSRIVASDTSRVAALSYSRGVAGGTFYVSAFQALDGTRNTGIFAGFSRALPSGINVSSDATGNGDGTRLSAQLSRSEENETGSSGWNILAASDSAGQRPELRGQVSYRASGAHFVAEAGAVGNGVRVSGEMTGSVVLAGGEMFAANRIDDAFAVVDAGAPDVAIYSDNNPVGRSNPHGKLLVTGLHAYIPNTIAIETDDVPLDSEASTITQTVVPAYRSGVAVTFAIKPLGAAAIVVLRDAAGNFIPAGANGQLADGGNFIVGYDGQAYLTGLHAANIATVDVGDGHTCTARFAFTASEVQPTIDGVTCA